jgi:hypothetical protein
MTLVASGQAASLSEAKDACEAALVQALGLSDVRRLGLPVHVSEGRTLWGCALTLRVGTKRPWPAATGGLHEAGGWRREGDVASSPRLSPWGRTGTIRLKLKLACRRFQWLPGLDGPPPRDRLCKRSSVGPSPSLRNAPHLWPTERHETYSRHKSRISDRINLLPISSFEGGAASTGITSRKEPRLRGSVGGRLTRRRPRLLEPRWSALRPHPPGARHRPGHLRPRAAASRFR